MLVMNTVQQVDYASLLFNIYSYFTSVDHVLRVRANNITDDLTQRIHVNGTSMTNGGYVNDIMKINLPKELNFTLAIDISRGS